MSVTQPGQLPCPGCVLDCEGQILHLEKGGTHMASVAMRQDFIEAVAAEVAQGIDAAVECWMIQVEAALENPRLTTLGRIQAVREVVNRYKMVTDKEQVGRAS